MFESVLYEPNSNDQSIDIIVLIFFRKYAPHLAFYGSQIQNLFSTELFTPRRPVKSAIVGRCETVLIYDLFKLVH